RLHPGRGTDRDDDRRRRADGRHSGDDVARRQRCRAARADAGAMERGEPARANPGGARVAQPRAPTVRLQPGRRRAAVPRGRVPDAESAVPARRGQRLRRAGVVPLRAPGRLFHEAAVTRQRRRERGRGRRRMHTAGFTLLELLVAVALLSVLAVLSWRGMDSVLRSRDRIVEASDDLRALSVAFAQMEQDVRGTWAVGLLGLPEPSIAFTVRGDPPQPEMALLREASANLPLQLQHVRYRLNGGRLERGFAPWTPSVADPARPFPEQRFLWQPLLAGIEQIQMRAWIP